ncbi:MAG: hypothetical protein [Caudoviricetes sp.]|nr:MAG: hypothetical protein [Caudoviricetes sp.]
MLLLLRFDRASTTTTPKSLSPGASHMLLARPKARHSSTLVAITTQSRRVLRQLAGRLYLQFPRMGKGILSQAEYQSQEASAVEISFITTPHLPQDLSVPFVLLQDRQEHGEILGIYLPKIVQSALLRTLIAALCCLTCG